MPQAPNPITSLNEGDVAYLRSQIESFCATPNAEKEVFRVACTRHILSQRGLEEDVCAQELFRGKIRNWFQNHVPKVKTSKVPMRVNQSFTGMRVCALKNEESIRENAKKLLEVAPNENPIHIVAWNNALKAFWRELPAEEKDIYSRVAEKWNEDGPEEDVKPLLAEKRGPSWMRASAELLWTQCKMPVFIYGMYKDSNGELHATVYDTSNLWREKDKATALFRNVLSWDKDFRRVAWHFFGAALRPDLFTSEILDVVQASRRAPPPPFLFDCYDDGCPILVNKEDGNTLKNPRRRDAMREYMKLHYSLAVGQEKRSAPWNSFHQHSAQFFADGMLPNGVVLQDPSHMSDGDLVSFFKHVIDMENPSNADVAPRRFRINKYATGPRQNPTFVPAVYSGVVEPWHAKRTKKTVSVPDWDGPPSPIDSSSSLGTSETRSRQPTASPLPSRLSAALNAEFEKLQMDSARSSPVNSELPTEDGDGQPELPTSVEPIATRRGRRAGVTTATSDAPLTPWIEAEIDATSVLESSEDDDDVDIYSPLQEELDADADDDEVEDFLNDNLDFGLAEGIDAYGAEHTAPEDEDIHGTADNIATDEVPTIVVAPSTTDTLRAPKDVGTDLAARHRFLQDLAQDSEYISLLERVHDKLTTRTTLRAQAPVFWATWGHKVPHVPSSVLTSDAHVATLMKWVTKARGANPQSAEAQRVCLAIGIILRDLMLMSNAASTSTNTGDMPTGLELSKLDPGRCTEVLRACSSAFVTGDADGEMVPQSRPKGKGKAKATVGVLTEAAEVLQGPATMSEVSRTAGESSGTTQEGQTAAERRTTRSSARRQ